MGFLSTPSARRATRHSDRTGPSRKISIHALREEGDGHLVHLLDGGIDISIHALREEGDIAGASAGISSAISIHALREEGDSVAARTDSLRLISIHALREEGDYNVDYGAKVGFLFLSTPSARRATRA